MKFTVNDVALHGLILLVLFFWFLMQFVVTV